MTLFRRSVIVPELAILAGFLIISGTVLFLGLRAQNQLNGVFRMFVTMTVILLFIKYQRKMMNHCGRKSFFGILILASLMLTTFLIFGTSLFFKYTKVTAYLPRPRYRAGVLMENVRLLKENLTNVDTNFTEGEVKFIDVNAKFTGLEHANFTKMMEDKFTIVKANFTGDVEEGNFTDGEAKYDDDEAYPDVEPKFTDWNANTTTSTLEYSHFTIVEVNVTDVDVQVKFTDVSANITDVSANIIDDSANITDVSANITDVSANITDDSANITDVTASITDVSANITDVNADITDVNTSITTSTLESFTVSNSTLAINLDTTVSQSMKPQNITTSMKSGNVAKTMKRRKVAKSLKRRKVAKSMKQGKVTQSMKPSTSDLSTEDPTSPTYNSETVIFLSSPATITSTSTTPRMPTDPPKSQWKID